MPKKRSTVCLWLAASSYCAFALAAISQEEPLASNDALTNTSDWQIFLQARRLKDFLHYKGSGLAPVTEVVVSYRIRDQKWQWQQTRVYESFWFSNGQPIGCRRFESLPLTPQTTRGVAVIEQSSDGASNTKALANSLVRVLLDLHLKDAFVSQAVVPDDYFELLSGDMAHIGFYEKHTLSQERGIAVRLVSEQAPQGKFFFFRAN